MRAPRLRAVAVLAALTWTLLLAASPAGAGSGATPLNDPKFDWKFKRYLSDGLGGIKVPPEQIGVSHTQTGGEVDDEETLSGSSPQLQVFSNAAATSFWARARSPSGAPDLLDTPLGSQVTFDITQTFRKDEENATLTFTLTAVELEASDPLPGAPSNDGLWAVLAIYVDGLQDGTPFFHFEDIERLSGTGLDWVYTHQSGPLALEVTEGGEDQLSITLALPQPYEGVIDLSSIDPTETFTIYYTITADVVDTKQEDSRISVYARDPIDPESGSFFTYSGLTAIPAPEPGNTLLLATGAAVLLLAGRRRRGSKAAATVGACVSA